jgi:hypothetical protein
MLATGNSGSKYRIVICPVSNKFTEDDVEALSNYLGERDTSKISRYAVLPELHNILLMNHKVVSKDDRMNSFLKKLLYSSVHMYEEDADTDLFYTHILQLPLVFSPKAHNADPDVTSFLGALAKTASPDFNGTTEDFVDPLPIMSRVYDAYSIFWNITDSAGVS